MISQKAKYALRALVALVKAGPGASLMISDIARDQSIPKKFLEQILLELKRAGIVLSRRGRLGGYALLRAPGEITFAINSQLLAQGITASDAEVGLAVGFAFRELKLVVEPGGAVGLAALLAGRIDVKGKNVVIVLSGGNVDADLFARLIG